MSEERRILRLTEHRGSRHPRATLSEDQGAWLYANHGERFEIVFPSPATNGEWELMSNGYVGMLAIPDGPVVVIQPKVPVANITRMLAEVFEFEIRDAKGLLACATLPELYEQLLRILATQVLVLCRSGLHQAYRRKAERLSSLRGRIDLLGAVRDADARLLCHFDERTGDILENQIPLGTIDRLLRSGLIRSDLIRSSLREAFRRLGNVAEVRQVTAADCTKVRFSRLTDRYRTVISLCRLILELSAPAGDVGDREGVPFLLYMPELFERYVAARLRRWYQADGRWMIQEQEHWPAGSPRSVPFYMDIVVRESTSDRVVAVLDTKYKDHETPSAADVAQVGYYALATGATMGGLIYPTRASDPWRARVGRADIMRLAVDLSANLDDGINRLAEGLALGFESAFHSVREPYFRELAG